jgi:hypothetical protein
MLADAARNDGFAVRDAIHRLDDVLRLHEGAFAVVVQAVGRLQRRDLAEPRIEACREPHAPRVRDERIERRGQQAHVVPIGLLDLVDLGRIDVEVQDALGLRRELGRHSGDTIVETRADRDQQIAVVDGVVRARRAVHAEHVQRQRMFRVETAEPHERARDGNLEGAHERAQRGARVRVDDAAAGIDQRPLRFAEHREEFLAARVREPVVLDCCVPLPVARDR